MTTTTSTPTDDARKRLALWTLAMALVAFLIASLHPLARAADEGSSLSFFFAHAWVAVQSLIPLLPVAATALGAAAWRPRLTSAAGMTIMALWPILILGDVVAFHSIGERLLSRTMGEIIGTLLPGLLPYISSGMIVGGVAAILAVSVMAAGLSWLVRVGARRWSTEHAGAVHPSVLLAVATIVLTLCAAPAIWNFSRTRTEMADHSTRHPWCAIGWVDYHNAGARPPTGAAAVRSRLRALSLAPTVRVQERQFRLNVASLETDDAGTRPPDMLIIISESMRPELIDPDVMPNVHAFAGRGMWLRQHFSGGNASSLGMFALLNGLESTWFYRSTVRHAPAMNRLVRQAGYECGFFAGDVDWASFQMDDYLNENVYDTFQVEPREWLPSDRRMMLAAEDYLRPDPDRPPRVAVLFLYSTHATFDVDPLYATDQPSVSKNYVMPFAESMRPAVWNRYRNAARSIDASLGPLLADQDRITVFCGDHGEAFLEDGTISHGTRLSKVQTMTPTIIAGPGIPVQNVDSVTMHADVLPTILDAAGIRVTRPDLFDGVSLIDPGDALQHRTLAVASYIGDEILLVGPWTNQPNQPLGHRVAFSMHHWKVSPLNAVDERGLEWQSDSATTTGDVLSDYLLKHFGTDPTRDDRSIAAWLAVALQSDERDDRLEALEIINESDDPSATTMALIADQLHSPDEEIRERARDVIINLKKRVTGSSP